MPGPGPVVVAVDGGGSKTHGVALTLDGDVVAEAAGPGSSPHLVGLDTAVATVDRVVRTVLAGAPGAPVAHRGVYLSGVDLPPEVAAFRAALAPLPWVGAAASDGGLAVDNDLFALLRAGTDEPDAVAVVCGTGINAVGVRADGARVRFPALGMISGDWGGGWDLGSQALWHAARAVDGRGPWTTLVDAVPRTLGLPDVPAVIEALHYGRIPSADLALLSPAVLAASASGDPTARSIVDRQATEVVDLVRATLTRLDLLTSDVPVVLGGGVLASNDRRLLAAIRTGIATIAPRARLVTVELRPVVGAAMLALESAGAPPAAVDRARAQLR